MAKYSLEPHSIRIHPKLWEWAKSDAEALGYEGGASGLISGLLLYNHALKQRRHWLTVDLVNDHEKLEAVIKEIEDHDPMKGSATWLEARLRELFFDDAKNLTPPHENQEKA